MTAATLQEDLAQYLAPTSYIDSRHPRIVQKAIELTKACDTAVAKATVLYEFVRDSYTQMGIDSFVASEVLEAGGNLCYQRSILLSALCRAAGIPARLHLQKISISAWRRPSDGQVSDICFAHGLAGLYLRGSWNVYEATGNSYKWLQWTGAEAEAARMVVQFDPDHDCLFDMRVNPRVTGEVLRFHFADRTEEMIQMIDRMNNF